jgi:hypothetical protein
MCQITSSALGEADNKMLDFVSEGQDSVLMTWFPTPSIPSQITRYLFGSTQTQYQHKYGDVRSATRPYTSVARKLNTPDKSRPGAFTEETQSCYNKEYLFLNADEEDELCLYIHFQPNSSSLAD